MNVDAFRNTYMVLYDLETPEGISKNLKTSLYVVGYIYKSVNRCTYTVSECKTKFERKQIYVDPNNPCEYIIADILAVNHPDTWTIKKIWKAEDPEPEPEPETEKPEVTQMASLKTMEKWLEDNISIPKANLYNLNRIQDIVQGEFNI